LNWLILIKLPIDGEEESDVDNWEQVAHGSQPNVGRVIIVVISVEEEIEAEGCALPDEFLVLNHRVGHVVVPLG